MKRIISVLLVCVMMITMFLAFAGCAAANNKTAYDQSTATMDSMQSESAENKASYGGSGTSESKAGHYNTTAVAGKQSESPKADGALVLADRAGTQTPHNILGDRKIIFNAFVVLEVEDFDTKLNMITSMVENSGIGYVQSSNVSSHKISNNPEKYRKEGKITLRVAQSKFNNILNEVQKLGTVRDIQRGTQEVTDMYFDTKYRAQMYEAERDRIMEYLKKANDLNTMLQLERKLSEITYEIEKLKGSLRKWDDLVEFATITIDLREKVPGEEVAENKPKSYGEKLLDALVDSFAEMIKALGDFVIVLVRALPTLLILGILYLIAKPYLRKLFNHGKKKDNDNDVEG